MDMKPGLQGDELPGMQGGLGLDMLPGLQPYMLPGLQDVLPELDQTPGVPDMQPGLQDDVLQTRKKWTMEKKWKELTRDGSGNMSLQQVTDRGIQMTTRSLGAGRVRREKGLMIVKMKRVEEDESNDDEEVRISISEDMTKTKTAKLMNVDDKYKVREKMTTPCQGGLVVGRKLMFEELFMDEATATNKKPKPKPVGHTSVEVLRRMFEEENKKKKDDKRSLLPRKDLRKTATIAVHSPGKIKKKKKPYKKDLSTPQKIKNLASNVWKDLTENDDLRLRNLENLERSNLKLRKLASTRGPLEGVSPPKQDDEV